MVNLSLAKALQLQRRDREIQRLARTKTLADIARRFGLTRQRVHQIVRNG